MDSVIVRKNLVGLLVSVLLGACGGGGGSGSSNPHAVVPDDPVVTDPVLPDPVITDPVLLSLMAGNSLPGPVISHCDDPVSELESSALNILCALFSEGGAAACINASSSCNTFRRELYTGSVLEVVPGKNWNGRGGSGAPMAEAAVCAMRELSKSKGIGPLVSPAQVNIGIGNVRAVQEVGYRDFNRTTGHFQGYRTLRLEMPVLGKFDAISQDVDLDRVVYATHFNNHPYAGELKITHGYGIDLLSQQKTRSLTIKPPAFDITTPIGIFEAQPEFEYAARTAVIHAPLASTHTDVPYPADGANALSWVVLNDLYGVIPGVAQTTQYSPPNSAVLLAQYRTGWASQIALGTRGTGSETAWTPPSTSPVLRPDYDPSGTLDFTHYDARSATEQAPTIEVSASAALRYPENPQDLLPSWVFGLPGLSTVVYIQVTPTIKAAAAGQLGFEFLEGNQFLSSGGEFGLKRERFASMGIYSGVEADASFFIDTELRIKVSADFGWPVGKLDMIDIHPHYPVPLAGGSPSGSAVRLATAVTGSTQVPVTALTELKTFAGVKANPAAFIEDCYAPENVALPEPLPDHPTEKGNPADLTPPLWHCNICIASDPVVNSETGQLLEPAHADLLLPASTPPSTWHCDAKIKSGCMELCTFDPSTHTLTVVKNPDQIAADLPASDPLKTFLPTCKNPPMTGTVALVSKSPDPDAPTPVPVDTTIVAGFNTALNPDTVNTSSVSLSPPVAGTVVYDHRAYTVTFVPEAPLEQGQTYTVTFAADIADAWGNRLGEAVSWSFSTVPATNEPHHAFVTSVQGNGLLAGWPGANGQTGVAAGDAVCQTLAAAAGLSGPYVAWLSSASDDAWCRVQGLSGKKSANCGQSSLPAAAGPWLRLDEVPFAGSLTALAASGLVYTPVLLDESALPVAGDETYFTGTLPDGTADVSTNTCYDWSSNSRLAVGVGGYVGGTTTSWSYAYHQSCSATAARLLCLEQGEAPALTPPSETGRKVFVSSLQGAGNLGAWPGANGLRGLAAADAVCQSLAAGAGLANASAFKAWLSDSASQAAQRLTSNGPWVRVDGVPVADSLADLTDASLFTGISVTELGVYTSASVWTNTTANGNRDSPVSTLTCDGWSSADAAHESQVGDSSLSFGAWSDAGYAACNTQRALYCFED